MELTVTILAAVMVATTAFYLLQVYKFDLQMMQQNSYRNERYFKWWRMSKDYASMSRISDLAVFLLLVSMFPKVVTLPIAIIVFAIKAAILLKKKYKKPLVMTKRVWRLLSAMIVATLVVAALSCSPHADAGHQHHRRRGCAHSDGCAFVGRARSVQRSNAACRKINQQQLRQRRATHHRRNAVAEGGGHHGQLRQDKHQALSEPHP